MSWLYFIGATVVVFCLASLSAADEATPFGSSSALRVLQFWLLAFMLYQCRDRCAEWANVFARLAAGGASPTRRARTVKTTHTGRGSWFSFASCEMQGWRDAMEDAVVCLPAMDGVQEDLSLFAVFDGHGGSEVSAYASEQIIDRVRERLAGDVAPGAALKQTLLDIEGDLRKLNKPCTPFNSVRPAVAYVHPSLGKDRCRYDFMGCTAVAALLTRSSVTVVNVGDSRVLKCRGGKCIPLTRDHKPESPRERRRIEAAGGTVVKMGPCYRVDGMLNLSRALGDFRYKDHDLAPEDQKVSPVGDVMTVEIDKDDEFLLVACDGLFELMTWESVCEYVHQRLPHMPLAKIAEGLLDECCSPDVHSTCGRGTDNESVILVKLHDPSFV